MYKMSKSNQRRLDCLHEAGHAVMAWIDGVAITAVRLVPDYEAGSLAATTGTVCPAPAQWTPQDIVSHMRIVLAGPQAEQLGPAAVSARDRKFAKWEGDRNEHP